MKPIRILIALFIFPVILHAQIAFVSKKTGLTAITDITHANDGSGRIFVVEKRGTIKILDSAYNTVGTLLDLSVFFVSTAGEKGLLGLAFHPSYKTNGYFFVNYNPSGTNHTRIARFTSPNPASNSTASILTEKIILNITTANNTNHKAGDLAFGPDSLLYITTGDGGGSGDPQMSGQNKKSFLAKILRLDINTNLFNPYDIPPSNPFYNDTSYLPEIWDMGLRNPWRISFDKETGDLWIADVGQGNREEINFESPNSGGNNYGWNCREGLIGYNSACQNEVFVNPIFDYPHCSPCNTKGFGNSITGGFVYRGTKPSNSSMKGYYIAADYVSKHAWAIKRTPGPAGFRSATLEVKTIANLTPSGVTSFGEIQNGEILAGLENGTLGTIEATTSLPVSLTQFNGQWAGTTSIELKWNTASEFNTMQYHIEKSIDGVDFASIGRVAAIGSGTDYSFKDASPFKSKNYYRLRIEDLDGAPSYSNIIVLQDKTSRPFAFYRANAKEIQLPSVHDLTGYTVELFTSQGSKIKHTFQINGRLPVQDIPNGLYILRMQADGISYTQKMMIY